MNVEQLYCSILGEEMPKMRRDAQVEMIWCINKCERKRVRRKPQPPTHEKKNVILLFISFNERSAAVEYLDELKWENSKSNYA